MLSVKGEKNWCPLVRCIEHVENQFEMMDDPVENSMIFNERDMPPA